MPLPFDSKPSDTGFLCKHVPPHAVNVWLGRGLRIELFRVVFVVDIVAHSDEFSAIVATCEEDDSDAENLGCRDPSEVWGISFKYELVDADGNRTDEERIKLLVML